MTQVAQYCDQFSLMNIIGLVFKAFGATNNSLGYASMATRGAF
jgi:hypothetical protein